MRPRQEIIESFSTFVQFDAERFKNWATDAKLRRSMQQLLARSGSGDRSQKFWALYWHKLWQATPDSLGKGHLSAYLQETCYWAAQKTALSFASSQYSLSDCFQMAIANLDKVLQGFNPQQGVGLHNYASAIFKSTIRETLRQRQEVDICTPWALLRKLSQKRLIESLEMAGLNPETIDRYILAWSCFNTIYVPHQSGATRQLPRPTVETWSAIANLYNSQRYQQLSTPGAESNAETIEKWLTAGVKAARAYLYPAVTSIYTPQSAEGGGELLDELATLEGESLLTIAIAQEEEQNRQSQQHQIADELVKALAALNPEERQLIELYYRQGLTQQQMAKQVGIPQYTVSRRLTKARQALLKALAQWSQASLHITLTSDLLKNASAVLEDWLITYYQSSQPAAEPE